MVVVGIKHELSLARTVLSMACLCQLLKDRRKYESGYLRANASWCGECPFCGGDGEVENEDEDCPFCDRLGRGLIEPLSVIAEVILARLQKKRWRWRVVRTATSEKKSGECVETVGESAIGLHRRFDA